MQGRYLDEASVKEDVLVYVGNANATVISLGPDTLIIQPPPSAPGKGDLDNSTDTNLAFVKVKSQHPPLLFKFFKSIHFISINHKKKNQVKYK